MTRIGRDSTTAADIPLNGLAVAMGYANGLYAWKAADWARFHDAGIATASIDVNGSHPTADILDIEAGDATVGQAPAWVRAHNQAGGYPAILYADRSTLTPLFNALLAGGLHVQRDFRLWIATLDGTKSVPDMTGVTAVQYAGSLQTGGHYDESVIYDASWKAAPKPPAPPPPAPAPVTLVKVTATATFSDGSTKSWTV